MAQNGIKILFLAAEAEPFVKIGGLGDVAGSLPGALRALSSQLDVRLCIPKHKVMNLDGFDLKPVASFVISRSGQRIPAQVFETHYLGTPIYLIDGSLISSSQSVYSPDMSSDGEKYTFFSLAAIELLHHISWQPDIVHANDWHTAPAVYALQQRLSDPHYAWIKSIIEIHNLPFMGGGASPFLSAYGLHPSSNPHLPDWARHFPLPMAIATADAIVAVSPAYARELLTPEFGCGLQDFLRTRADVLSGILNGIDLAAWNPKTDKSLESNFDINTLNLRAANKAGLQSTLSLPVDPEVPILAMITRMDPQKGVDIALDGLRLAAGQNWQAVILGTGIPYLEDAVRSFQDEFPDRVRAEVRYDAKLSRQIYAGADILLIPSRYEPCGLAQMIAMRYGCVPLGRATGGLNDTIHAYTDSINGTGFLFDEATSEAFANCLDEAFIVYGDRDRWLKLQHNGMSQDFSWENAARQYFELYRQLASIKDTDHFE
jgi:starch synthase